METQPAPIGEQCLVGGSTSWRWEPMGVLLTWARTFLRLVGKILSGFALSRPESGPGSQEQGPQTSRLCCPHPMEDLVDSEDKEGQVQSMRTQIVLHVGFKFAVTCPSRFRTSALPVIYVGNVKLQAGPVDTIAGAFLQSSRKTLHFVPPTRQNGEVIIRPTKEVVDNGSKKWHTTAVGYFLGRRPYFPQLEAFARANWKGLQHVSALSFFRFHTRFAMEDVIEGGPWLFQGQPIVLQCWEQGMSLRRQQHSLVPVWIRLKHLPMEYWTEEGLSTVASGIGTPLYSDGITKDLLSTRLCPGKGIALHNAYGALATLSAEENDSVAGP
ncbi:UNVERIFIED_CONTAM: hypothetical protein Scaly_3108000 [Sesamum calycinum]|uniref:DUF4283 domain-containing protein n=1 Tax=Sesamum calycinum TaxID=2727403 RepID=A0AAW2JLW5_9LAMI